MSTGPVLAVSRHRSTKRLPGSPDQRQGYCHRGDVPLDVRGCGMGRGLFRWMCGAAGWGVDCSAGCAGPECSVRRMQEPVSRISGDVGMGWPSYARRRLWAVPGRHGQGASRCLEVGPGQASGRPRGVCGRAGESPPGHLEQRHHQPCQVIAAKAPWQRLPRRGLGAASGARASPGAGPAAWGAFTGPRTTCRAGGGYPARTGPQVCRRRGCGGQR
jgi:hypothetical protein